MSYSEPWLLCTVMAYAEVYADQSGPLSNAMLAIEVGRTEADSAIETAPMRFTDRKGEGKRTAEGAIPVAMLASGDYVARVVATLDGKVVGMLGKAGRQLGQFGWIHGMACPSENTLYVAEILNWRVQKLLLHDRPAPATR